METKIFYSINSGLFFQYGDTGLLADGLFTGDEFGWSVLPPVLEGQLRTRTGLFAHCDGAVYTHDHSDHFHQAYFDVTQNYAPPMPYYKPDGHSPEIAVLPRGPGSETFQIGNIEVLSVKTIHDGKGGELFDHRSLLLRCGGECFFLPSDAALKPSMLPLFTDWWGGAVTAGFFNLFQLMSPEGQAFIRGMRPRRVFLYHLPFPKDDKFNYFNLSRRAASLYAQDLPALERLEPMAWLDRDPPPWAVPGGE